MQAKEIVKFDHLPTPHHPDKGKPYLKEHYKAMAAVEFVYNNAQHSRAVIASLGSHLIVRQYIIALL